VPTAGDGEIGEQKYGGLVHAVPQPDGPNLRSDSSAGSRITDLQESVNWRTTGLDLVQGRTKFNPSTSRAEIQMLTSIRSSL